MLQLFDIRKSYTTADFTQVALDDVSIAFRDNEFVAILGPSGSGKTTMLNIIGGLDQYDSGSLVIDGIKTEQYKDRDWDAYRNNRIGFVFQNYNLIPHQTVLSNVELALTLSGVSRSERRHRAKAALAEVGLKDHINKRPNQLSGGQMQRVAVARALINDPEILLADEPTGALDSTTSTQIMDLLTEIARDRLVIIVTHNSELASAYATRTINLLDGKVVNDSNSFIPTPEEEKISTKKVRRAAMSFFTAISLSFNNLMTKKGRTIMTAFAGSIGIIGIAAILALASGVNNYIKSVEEDTLSMYPLSIESTGIDMTAMMASMMGGDVADGSDSGSEGAGTDAGGEKSIKETKTLVDMLEGVESNDLKSLKAFLDDNGGNVNKYAQMISYSYGIEPKIFNPDTSNGIWQVNPNTAFSALSGGGALSGAVGEYAAMMTSGGNVDIFSEMFDNPELLDVQYDVLAGRWPEQYNECIVVLNHDGGINDYTLYAMNLRDPRELDAIVDQVANNETAVTPEDQLEFTYDEILGVKFKLVNAADLYAYDEEFNVWKNKNDDAEFLKQAIASGEDLSVVGIVQAKPDASVTILSPGISYPSSMQAHLIDEALQSKIVQEQLANPELDIITGRTFAEEKENPDNASLDFSSMFQIDGEALSSAFSFNAGALQIDTSSFSNMDLSGVQSVQAPPFDPTVVLGQINNDIDQAKVNELSSNIMQSFLSSSYYNPSMAFDQNAMAQAFSDYLNSPEGQELVATGVANLVDDSTVGDQLQVALQQYMQSTMELYTIAMAQAMQQQIATAMEQSMSQLATGMSSAMDINEDVFAKVFNFDFDEKELTELMMSYMSVEERSYESNLRSFGYADFDNPATIYIYPKDFQSKEYIIDILDNYNARAEEDGYPERAIIYSDLVGTLMSSVTEIVNMVSAVLVAFVAISLVVSSIMIGIITYISVLERRKEIGILRSIGASKGDIARVFNAETLIVGFIAGLIGVVITALLCIPANMIIYDLYGVPNVASLPWQPAIILVVVSMFLSFIAGLIPASSASRKDPVEALRSE